MAAWPWVLANAVPEFDVAGEFVGHIGTATDITARKLAEERVAQQLQDLQRWYQATLDREDRVQALKQQVNALRQRLGEAPRYRDPAHDAQNSDTGPAP